MFSLIRQNYCVSRLPPRRLKAENGIVLCSSASCQSTNTVARLVLQRVPHICDGRVLPSVNGRIATI
jgi:hypothetical protein